MGKWKWYCTLCNFGMDSRLSYDNHIFGQKHRQAVEKAGLNHCEDGIQDMVGNAEAATGESVKTMKQAELIRSDFIYLYDVPDELDMNGTLAPYADSVLQCVFVENPINKRAALFILLNVMSDDKIMELLNSLNKIASAKIVYLQTSLKGSSPPYMERLKHILLYDLPDDPNTSTAITSMLPVGRHDFYFFGDEYNSRSACFVYVRREENRSAVLMSLQNSIAASGEHGIGVNYLWVENGNPIEYSQSGRKTLDPLSEYGLVGSKYQVIDESASFIVYEEVISQPASISIEAELSHNNSTNRPIESGSNAKRIKLMSQQNDDLYTDFTKPLPSIKGQGQSLKPDSKHVTAPGLNSSDKLPSVSALSDILKNARKPSSNSSSNDVNTTRKQQPQKPQPSQKKPIEAVLPMQQQKKTKQPPPVGQVAPIVSNSLNPWYPVTVPFASTFLKACIDSESHLTIKPAALGNKRYRVIPGGIRYYILKRLSNSLTWSEADSIIRRLVSVDQLVVVSSCFGVNRQQCKMVIFTEQNFADCQNNLTAVNALVTNKAIKRFSCYSVKVQLEIRRALQDGLQNQLSLTRNTWCPLNEAQGSQMQTQFLFVGNIQPTGMKISEVYRYLRAFLPSFRSMCIPSFQWANSSNFIASDYAILRFDDHEDCMLSYQYLVENISNNGLMSCLVCQLETIDIGNGAVSLPIHNLTKWYVDGSGVHEAEPEKIAQVPFVCNCHQHATTVYVAPYNSGQLSSICDHVKIISKMPVKSSNMSQQVTKFIEKLAYADSNLP